MSVLDAIQPSLIAELCFTALRRQIELQGHRATGSLADSLSYTAERGNGILTLYIIMNDYAAPLNEGVAAARIPFGGKSTGKKTSKYLQGLYRWATVKKLGNTPKERLRIVFAIAHTHKKTTNRPFGMPTFASRRFSKTGKRTGFIDDAIPGILAAIEQQFTTDDDTFKIEIEKQLINTI